MSRRTGAWFGLVLANVAATVAPAVANDAEGGRPKPCHKVETRVQYRGLAYQHVVVIHNQCDRNLDCTIKASSNPDTLEVRVEAKTTESVVVNNGSPAREFSAEVQCK